MPEEKDKTPKPDNEPTGHTGIDFAKSLRPIGMIMVLAMYIILLITMFSAGKGGDSQEHSDIEEDSYYYDTQDIES